MAKLETAPMTDGGLTKMNTCIHLTICAGQPTNFADIAARKLATVTFSASSFALAAGDVSGRKATVPQQTAMSITGSGTADHVVVDDGTDYIVTTCTGQALTSGGTVTAPAWKKEITAPT
jgi:hypothetical protein